MGLDNIFWHTFLKEGQRNNLVNTDWQFNIYGKRWERDWFCIRCDMRSEFIPSFIQGINLTQTGFWFQKRLLIWNWSTKNDKQHWYDSDWKISFRKEKKNQTQNGHIKHDPLSLNWLEMALCPALMKSLCGGHRLSTCYCSYRGWNGIHTVRIKFNIEIT